MKQNNYLYIHRCEASTLKVKGHGSYMYRPKSTMLMFLSCTLVVCPSALNSQKESLCYEFYPAIR